MKRTVFSSMALALATLGAAGSLRAQIAVSSAPFARFSALDAALTPRVAVSLPAAPLPSAEPARMSGSTAYPAGETLQVHPEYRFQYYAGYTFVAVNGIPNALRARQGFENSLVWYPRTAFGIEGSLFTTFGTQYTERSRFVFGAGGPRYRWLTHSGRFQGWSHALIGAAHYTPQTANGPQLAAAFEAGAGADLMPPHGRLGFRFGGDIVATHFFSTWQYSPKLSVGVVVNFMSRQDR